MNDDWYNPSQPTAGPESWFTRSDDAPELHMIPRPTDSALSIRGDDGELVVDIRMDGKITFGKGYRWRHRLAAVLFWRAVGSVIRSERSSA